ncbi:ABC transporter substrate-binding protein [Kitasatospora sp. MAP5-34]|uniref:ABC transporter substrate-binding protein n=1 Tax=Kitasatospora sp. MAP5-34 TaxID=3035102 RepID=UPI0024738172|nr:ABC transporter substrate-binding protein [Kitasatospora sp. MAP5-34]MDH6576840.1 ABC-type branched-subunit amino acid transport system substrate-binding protein [Kitasatospora sp. MAP5-34]
MLLAGCGSRLPESAFATRPAGPTASPASPGNGGATDTGVTPTEIRIGIVTSRTSPVGSETFSGPLYGAQAFFRSLNDRGGLHGRTVKVLTCDDGGSGIGNQDCVHQLIDHDQVFAFASGSVLDYAGAPYVSGKDVPDVGGQPIGTAYDRWPHLYGIYGSNAPRDGRTVGWNGTLYQSTEVFRFFKERLGARNAAVVAYNQADSARYAAQLTQGLEAEGYRVLSQSVDFALPGFQAVAAAMKADGSQLVFDAMDSRGNSALCQALDAAGVRLTAKVTNVQNWSEAVRTDYQSSPGCRNALWSTSSSRNYEDVGFPAVKEFRDAMTRWYPERESLLSAWELEGWAGAQWLTDAMDSCGTALTRACVERFMNRAQPYDAHGLILPASFTPAPQPNGPTRACLDAARWQDSAFGGHGGWTTQVTDMNTTCFDVPQLPYHP